MIAYENTMVFFTQAVSVIQTILILIGAGLGIWGVVNLLEGYNFYSRKSMQEMIMSVWLSWKGVWGKPFFDLQRIVFPRNNRSLSRREWRHGTDEAGA